MHFRATLLAWSLFSLANRVVARLGTSDANVLLRSRQQDCLAQDVWPPGPGTLLTPPAVPAELQSILDEIDESRIEAIVNQLASYGTRHTLSSQTDPTRGIGVARDWIAEQMRGFAAQAAKGTNATVTTPSFVQPVVEGLIPNATLITNIVMTIQGATEPNRVYIVSGHYDSRCTDILNFESDAPGADDDASGVAISMELARIMATRPPPPATMVFAAVAGEEQGLFGSNFMATEMANAGVLVQGMVTNDIVGASKADNGVLDPFSIRLFAQGMPTSESASVAAEREQIGGENDGPARELARFTASVASNDATGMNVRVIYRTDRYLRGGDHIPFLDQGFPAIRFTEPNENFAHQHQDVRVDPVTGEQFGDLVEFCDFGFITRMAKVNMAFIWSLANAPATPTNVTIDTSVLTNNSTFTWALPDAAEELDLISGYEVVWRATNDAFWTHAVEVGLVNKVTVLLSKDNVAFGIRAVGHNGLRSPATFPFPT